MDNHIDKNKNINIPQIYVSPADSNTNKIKQTDNIDDSKDNDFEQLINQVNLDNIEIPNNCLNFISNDGLNMNFSNQYQLNSSDSPHLNDNGISPINSNSSYNEAPEDDIQSFYSALEERFGLNDKSKNNVVEDFINNEIFGLNDQSNNNMQTSFLLPDINKIKSNSSGTKGNLLSISKVSSREGRRKSVSKSNRSRSATRSRSRSRSVTKSISDLSHRDDTGLIDAFSKVDLLEKDYNNLPLNVERSDIDYLSDISDNEIRSIFSEIDVDENPLDIEALMNDLNNNTPDASHIDDKEKKHVCKYCNFAFLRHHDLERHTSSHINRKNYPCKGYVFGELPPVAMLYLRNEQNLKENPSLFDLNELMKIINDVENQKSTTTWGCLRSFFRSDSLSRHLKSKTQMSCLKQAYEDFIQGNVYFHHRFLSLRKFIHRDILKKSNDENKIINSEKFIKADILIKDMDKNSLDNETWPISKEQFQKQYQNIYCKNLQKYIQREAKFKKMAEK